MHFLSDYSIFFACKHSQPQVPAQNLISNVTVLVNWFIAGCAKAERAREKLLPDTDDGIETSVHRVRPSVQDGVRLNTWLFLVVIPAADDP